MELLLARLLESGSQQPMVIAGDVNMDLAAANWWQQLVELGWVQMHHGPTCFKNEDDPTCIDVMLVNRTARRLVRSASFDAELLAIPPHVPLLLTLRSGDYSVPVLRKLSSPEVAHAAVLVHQGGAVDWEHWATCVTTELYGGQPP
eukprot:5481953-Amphidinium_carterae.1